MIPNHEIYIIVSPNLRWDNEFLLKLTPKQYSKDRSICIYDLEMKSIIYASFTSKQKNEFEDMILLNNSVEGKEGI